MGTNARPLVPLLVQRLQSRNLFVAMDAVQALGELKIEPELVVPALGKALQDPNQNVQISSRAAFALARFGNLSRPALPTLTNALNDPDPSVREGASNAIARITGGTNDLTPDWPPFPQ
jgi:HEAT repeat protein